MVLSEQNVLDADGPRTAAPPELPGWSAARRVRDLGVRGRLVALLLVLALAAPFGASIVEARNLDWTPTGDEALITLRVREVFSTHPPLIGQPSTADHYAEVDPPHHPGPIQFYLLAPFVKVLGPDLGMLLGVGLINLLAVLTVPWVALRRGGPLLALGAAVVVSTVAWSQGIAVLTDNISSNAGGIPLLALAALAWGVVDRDLRLLPAAALAFSFVAQQHLAILGNALGMGAWAGFGLVIAIVAWHRNRSVAGGSTAAAVEGAPVEDPLFIDPAVEIWVPVATEAPAADRPWPWVAGAAAVGFVAWLPVLIDQFFGQGNLSRIAGFASAGERESLGLRSGATQALRALGLPPLLLRTNLKGGDMIAALSPVAVGVSVLVIASLVAVIVVRRRSAPAHAALAATTLVLAAVGAFNGGNVPNSLEAYRINFYRWMFVVSVGTCLTLGWALVSIAARGRGPAPRWTGTVAAAAAVLMVAAVSVAAIDGGEPQVRRDQQVFADVHQLNDLAAHALAGKHTIYLAPQGVGATLSLGPAMAQALVGDGYDVRVSATLEEGYRSHMVLQPGEHVDAVLVVQSARELADLSTVGKPLAVYGLNDTDADLLKSIEAAIAQGGVVRSDDFDQQVAEVFGDGPGTAEYVDQVVAMLEAGDARLVSSPVITELIASGALVLPDVDAAAIEAVSKLSMRTIWGDRFIGLRLLTPAEAGLETRSAD